MAVASSSSGFSFVGVVGMGCEICWRHPQVVPQNLFVLVEGGGEHSGEYVHDVFGNSGVIVALDVQPHC